MADSKEKIEEWKIEGQHIYDGLIFSPVFPKEALDQVKEFKLHPEDVLLCSYPKSGTVWLGEIVWLLCNDVNVEQARTDHTRKRVPILEMVIPGTPGCLPMLNQKPPGRVMATHLFPYFFEKEFKSSKPKVIVLLRNPKDTLVSFYHFYRAALMLGKYPGTFHDFFQLYLKKELNGGDFYDFIHQWWSFKDNDNFLFVKYEEMKKDIEGNVRKIASFLGKQPTEEQIKEILDYSSFDKMKANPTTQLGSVGDKMYDSGISQYIRKGQVGDWKNYFTVKENEIFNERHEKEMAGTQLEFVFE